jgi:hypothetical protein
MADETDRRALSVATGAYPPKFRRVSCVWVLVIVLPFFPFICGIAEMRHTSPQPSRLVWRKGAAPLSGAKEQTAGAINTYAQYACLLSLQMGSIS